MLSDIGDAVVILFLQITCSPLKAAPERSQSKLTVVFDAATTTTSVMTEDNTTSANPTIMHMKDHMAG